MDPVPSLTEQEARERAALLDVDRYDLAVDLTGLLDGDALRVECTVRFRCAVPGASTFLDDLKGKMSDASAALSPLKAVGA